jgi:hypothetical protein
MNLPSIFVQIASYRDPECQWTVRDLFEKAEHPERVFVGQCLQVHPVEDAHCAEIPSPRPDQTRTITVLPTESLGVCWARAQCQALYRDEDHVLMIDSHTRFIEGWDSALIAELNLCPSEKPLLSTYPPAYTPPHDLQENPKLSTMIVKPLDERKRIRFRAQILTYVPEHPLPGAFIAAGFIFTHGAFIREVPYDPWLYFRNEEVCLAARAYTHGWDVFSPSKTFIYHYYYVPSETEKRSLHWDDNVNWQELTRQSEDRYRYLLCHQTKNISASALQDIEKYGLGNTRSLEQYETFCGINFASQSFEAKALEGLPEAVNPPPGNDRE